MSNKEEWTETDENLSKLLESFTYEDTKRRKKQSTNSNVNPFESKASKLVHVECNECKGIGGVGFLLLKECKRCGGTGKILDLQ